jgi:hypothetical protein
VAAVAALLLLGGSAGASQATPAGSITNCTAMQTRSALVSFIAAFNAGDSARLDALFAGPSWFRWYSSSAPGARFDPQARTRGTLIAYFRARHAQRDRFRLVSFRFNGNTLGYANLVWKMRRSAGDFGDGAWFTVEAKGAARCWGASTRFITMSVGGPES